MYGRVPVRLAVRTIVFCAWLLNGLRTSWQVWVVNELHHDDNEKWATCLFLFFQGGWLQDSMATARSEWRSKQFFKSESIGFVLLGTLCSTTSSSPPHLPAKAGQSLSIELTRPIFPYVPCPPLLCKLMDLEDFFQRVAVVYITSNVDLHRVLFGLLVFSNIMCGKKGRERQWSVHCPGVDIVWDGWSKYNSGRQE